MHIIDDGLGQIRQSPRRRVRIAAGTHASAEVEEREPEREVIIVDDAPMLIEVIGHDVGVAEIRRGRYPMVAGVGGETVQGSRIEWTAEEGGGTRDQGDRRR